MMEKFNIAIRGFSKMAYFNDPQKGKNTGTECK